MHGQPRPTAQQTTPLATASLVLGVVGLVGVISFTGSIAFVLPGLLAIATGHLALNLIRRSERGLAGRGRAIGGLVGGYGTVTLSLLIMFGLMPMIGRARATAELGFCKSNLQQIGYACQMYTNSNKGSLPPSLHALNDYLGPPASVRKVTMLSCRERSDRAKLRAGCKHWENVELQGQGGCDGMGEGDREEP